MVWLDGSLRGQRLKDDIRSGRLVLGTFLNMGSPLAAEACAIAGFDWLLVDLEHGGRGEESLLGQVLAGAAHDVPVIVRVETIDRIRSGHVLDLGANGVMFPRVNSRDDAVRGGIELALSTRSAGGALPHTTGHAASAPIRRYWRPLTSASFAWYR